MKEENISKKNSGKTAVKSFFFFLLFSSIFKTYAFARQQQQKNSKNRSEIKEEKTPEFKEVKLENINKRKKKK